MQNYAASLLIAVAYADPSKFPRFDALHANCEMFVEYPNMTCDTLYTELDTELRSWADGDPSHGLIAVKEESSVAPSYIWTTRTTPVKKYVDDQIFELSQNGTTCTVHARSRSQTMSVYDYDTNYCNMWNALNYIGGMQNLSIKNCTYYPDVPADTCAIY